MKYKTKMMRLKYKCKECNVDFPPEEYCALRDEEIGKEIEVEEVYKDPDSVFGWNDKGGSPIRGADGFCGPGTIASHINKVDVDKKGYLIYHGIDDCNIVFYGDLFEEYKWEEL